MLRCLAVDDEPLALDLLVDNISKVPYLQLAGRTTDALEAVHLIQQEKIDLVFLDIQMPGLTGLQLIQSLEHKPLFILVTAYEKYALEGFELNVVDYLVKPVPLERFIKASNKAKELHAFRNRPPGSTLPNTLGYFFVPADYSHVKVAYADVLWIEGLKDYIRIHLKDGARPIVSRYSMKGLEELLPSSAFIRIQKSYLVSKEAITAIRKNSIFIGGQELPIGEQYKAAVYALIGRAPE